MSILVGIIWLISLLFKRAQPIFHYWLWCIVLVRLLFPINISVPTGVTHHFRNAAERKLSNVVHEIHFLEEMGNTISSVVTTFSSIEKSQTELSFLSLSISDICIIFWFMVVILLSLLLFMWFWHVNNLIKSCNVIERADIKKFLEQKCKDLQIKQKVTMYCFDTNMPVGPTVAGIFNPKILLPYRIIDQWSVKEIEPILLHELVHIKRRDPLINWIQIFIQLIYFFHPLVWFANWKIREKREELCDDITIQLIKNKRKRYSLNILNVLEGILYEPILGYADIGFSERRSSLAKRIIRIANKNYVFFKPLNVLSVIALVVISVTSISIACEQSPEKIIGDVPVAEEVETSAFPQLNPDRINIVITENGEYEVDGIKATPTDLEKVLKQVMENSKKKDVYIFPNPETSRAPILHALKVSESLGADRMAINKKK